MTKCREDEEPWNASHFNHHRHVAISIKTTGLDPEYHELVQITVFPLNAKLELSKQTIPFYVDMKPLKPKINLQLSKGLISLKKYEEIKENANTPQVVASLFDDWMENEIKLAEWKKLKVLTYDWPLKQRFVRKWLGDYNFDCYFSNEYRDILSIAPFMNDYADHYTQQIPYPKVFFSFICNILSVNYNFYDESIIHCKNICEVYKRMRQHFLPSLSENVIREAIKKQYEQTI